MLQSFDINVKYYHAGMPHQFHQIAGMHLPLALGAPEAMSRAGGSQGMREDVFPTPISSLFVKDGFPDELSCFLNVP